MISENRSGSSSRNPLFSILIPSWNSLAYLKLCIESIRKNSRYEHQIIVHINEGSDGSIEFIRGSGCDYSYSPKNIGVCYALNAARSLAKSDYLVFVNDDMYLCPDWDTFLYEEIKKIETKYFFLSGSPIEPLKTSNTCCISPFDFGHSVETFDETRLLSEHTKLIHHDWSGASWPPSVIHKDIWDLVGGYSIEFSPGMYSDPDFSMKLYQAGVRIFKGISKCRAYHFMCKSTNRIKKNNGRKTFLLKYGITSRLFYNHILKFGQKYDGPITIEPSDPIWFKLKRICGIKKLLTLF